MLPVIIAEEVVKFGVEMGVSFVIGTAGRQIAEKAALKGAEKALFTVGSVGISWFAGRAIHLEMDKVFDEINQWMLPDPEDAAKLNPVNIEEKEENVS